MRLRILLLLVMYACRTSAVGFAPELYCGLENCYDVLEINREEFDKTKLSKIYRTLAKKYHPDRQKTPEEKASAEERFRVIATAYETLKDDEVKTAYDYYLDHPDERWYNYYAYYRRRVAPKVDVRIVIAGSILLISLFQYFSARQKYSEALAFAVNTAKYRNAAIEIAVERKLLEYDTKGKLKKVKGRSNDEIIKSIVAENMDVRGGYKKESIYDTLLWHLISLPYNIGKYLLWCFRWVYRYMIKKEEYDTEAKLYLIRKNLGISEGQFACLSDAEHEEFLSLELWKKDIFKKWKADKETAEKEKLAQSGRYKRYRRYMKNNAGNTISFAEE